MRHHLPMRRALRLLSSLCLLALACSHEEPKPPPPAPTATATASLASKPAHPPIPPQPPPQLPTKPLDKASIAEHVQLAGQVRIWRLEPSDAGPGGKAMSTQLAAGRRSVKAFAEAIGGAQVLEAKKCEACAAALRIVFEGPAGLQLATLELDCPGQDPTQGYFRVAGSSACGEVKIADRKKLDALVAEAKARPAPANPMMP